MDLAAMTPQPKLTSTGYCLAHVGTEYSFTNLRAEELFRAIGSWHVRYEWFDVAKAEKSQTGTVQASEEQLFKLPFTGEAVLYLATDPTR
jgi:hypothetical protein